MKLPNTFTLIIGMPASQDGLRRDKKHCDFLQFLQTVGGTEIPNYFCAAKQNQHHETDTIIPYPNRRFR